MLKDVRPVASTTEPAVRQRTVIALAVALALACVVELELAPEANARSLGDLLERSASATLIWFAIAYCALIASEVATSVLVALSKRDGRPS